ncbi:MAG TPA: small ribosomal subunit Rsm22 family protein, partial [Myxococcota bacterium]
GAAVDADAAASLAYLAHFGPRAIAAVSFALTSVAVSDVVVDVGAGSGASALALVAAGAKRVVLVESSKRALEVAKRLLAGVVEVECVLADAAGARAKSANGAGLVLSAFSFAEMTSSLRAAMAARTVESIERRDAHRGQSPRRDARGNQNVGGEPVSEADADVDADADEDVARTAARQAFAQIEAVAPKAATLVVVDAGDRERARRLQALRDDLVDEGRAILAPCPHRDPCPALVRERDWCHQRVAKDLPEELARFARAVGRDDERMALSHLVIARKSGGDGAAPRDDHVLAIGDPLVEKGRARLPVCGPGGLRFVQALKRHREAYDALVSIERGTRLRGSLAALAKNAAGDTAVVDDPAAIATLLP